MKKKTDIHDLHDVSEHAKKDRDMCPYDHEPNEMTRQAVAHVQQDTQPNKALTVRELFEELGK